MKTDAAQTSVTSRSSTAIVFTKSLGLNSSPNPLTTSTDNAADAGAAGGATAGGGAAVDVLRLWEGC
jgi:hypothetical protein